MLTINDVKSGERSVDGQIIEAEGFISWQIY